MLLGDMVLNILILRNLRVCYFSYILFCEVHWIDWVLVYTFKFAKLLELFLQIFFLIFCFFPSF